MQSFLHLLLTTIAAIGGEVWRCGPPRDVPGHARITFQPDGHVSAVVVDAPPNMSKTWTLCVENRFRLARIPPFKGAPVTVGKSFLLKPMEKRIFDRE